MIPSLSLSTRLKLLLLIVPVTSSCTDYACACSPPVFQFGTYRATRLRFTPTGEATVDALSAGASITLTLSVGGATSGTFVVPASLNNGVPATFDLAGTYQQGTYVRFTQPADTFIRDVDWTWTETSLSTTGSAGGVQYDIVLKRQ